jgi:gliding motility-associated-like protein
MPKTFLCFFVSAFLLFSVNSYSQTLTSRWQYSWGGDGADFINDMISLPGKHYIFGGFSGSGISGNKTSPQYGRGDATIFEMDDAGNKLWEKSYGGNNYDRLNSFIKVSTGGYIIAGESESPPSGIKQSPLRGIGDFWVFKIDDNGNLIWEKSYGDQSYLNVAVKILEMPDGGFLVAGFSFPPNGGNLQEYKVIKIDKDGNLLWEKYYGGTREDELIDMIATSDGNYMLSGTSRSPVSGNKSSASLGGQDIWLVKITPDGTKLWDKSFGTPADDFRGRIINLIDNNILIIEAAVNTGRIRKIDLNGNELWVQTCSGNDQDFFEVATQNTNGDIYVAGTSKSNNAGCKTSPYIGGGWFSDIWIAIFDSGGNKIDDLDYGGNDADIPFHIEMINNECWISGFSDSPISGNKTTANYGQTADGWIIRLSKKLFINNLTLNTACRNVNSFKTYFTTTLNYQPGNVFTIQLSDANGNFTAPVNVGTKSAISSDSVLITLPSNLVAAANYQLRVIASRSSDTSGGYALMLYDKPVVKLGSDTAFCQNTPLVLTAGTQAANIKYLWSNGSAARSISTLSPGLYWCEVSNDCGSSRDTILTTLKPLPVTNLGPDVSFCSGSSIVIKQKTPQASVTYMWNTGQQTDSVIVRQGGTFWLTLTNNCGKTMDTITVIEKNTPAFKITGDTGYCRNASVLLSPDISGPVSSMLWSNASTANTITISNAGKYWLQVDLNGCKKTDSINVTQYELPAVQIQGNHLINVCRNNPVNLTASGASSYTWSNGLSGSNISFLDSGFIIVKGADIHACVNKDSAQIKWVNRETVKAFTSDTICYGGYVQLSAVGGEKFLWTPASILNNATIPNPIAKPSRTTNVIVMVTKDSTGCNIGMKDTIRLTVWPKVNATAGNDTLVTLGDHLQLHASGGKTYLWQPSTGLSNSTIANPIAIINSAINYSVIVTTQYGCIGTANLKISTIKGPEIYLPNAFTPNNDGINDLFMPIIAGFKSLTSFKIFDRFGTVVYETKQLGKGWDGRFKGIPLEPNIFIWTVEAVQNDNSIITKKGTVALIR